MGTNFYMYTTDKGLVKDYFINDYELTDEPYLSYEIHLCKCSGGWKTLFTSHMMAYTSFKYMCDFLRKHNDRFEIYDEYLTPISVEEFIVYMSNRDLLDYRGSPLFSHTQLDDRYWEDLEGHNFVERQGM